jgi:hypothetical protein
LSLQDLKPANLLLGRDGGLYVIDGDFYIKSVVGCLGDTQKC